MHLHHLRFIAPEYQSDGTFQDTPYEFIEQPDAGWLIRRNGSDHLRLGPGYTPVRTRHCGVCSTDLARRFLPYDLPQIIGHEIVGTHQGRDVVVEINASHAARALDSDCPFCSNGMDTQCPARITLGIDRLPGGFSPWFLAPVNAIREIPAGVGSEAVLTEPFAAALQAVESSAPRTGDRVAVLGPRRLGALIIAALAGYRRRENLDFEIIGLARHTGLLELSLALGADQALDSRKLPANEKFDLVFDTTGTPDGFSAALGLARRAVHLKSTHGQPVLGLQNITDLVVQEITLLPLAAGPNPLDFGWPEFIETAARENPNILVPPGIALNETDLNEAGLDGSDAHGRKRKFHRLSIAEALRYIDSNPTGSPFPRFDLALARDAAEVDAILRPDPEREISLVRARGAIVIVGGQTVDDSFEAPLREALARGVRVESSRCGDFRRALAMLGEYPEIAAALRNNMITHSLPLADVSRAFEIAADSGRSIKVVVDAPAE